MIPQKDTTTFKALGERRKEIFINSLRYYVEQHTLPKVAQLTGVSEAQISQYISGRKSAPTLITLVRISEGLNTTISNLIGDDTGRAEEIFLGEANIALINRLLRLNTAELQTIETFINLPQADRDPLITLINRLDEKQ